MTLETTIALGKLVPGRANVRRSASSAGIEELAASLSAHGLIQNLVVRKADKGGKYEVIAGGRRLAALKALMKSGGTVLGETVTKSYPVRVVVSEADSDTEISLAENTHREAMHVVDEVAAYLKLSEDGIATEDIAARFGQSVVTVRQRLKLASLSPRILAVLGEDGMTLEQAKALAVSDDHAAQEAVWFETSEWHRHPNQLRAALTREHVRVSDRLARFVGLEAYEAEGGGVLRDLFGEEDGTYLTDRTLLARLAGGRLGVVANQLREEGWKWVETSLDPAHVAIGDFGRVYPQRREPTGEERAQLAELEAERDDLISAMEGRDEEDDVSEDETKIAALEAKMEDIEDRALSYSEPMLALAGCIVAIGHDGNITVTRGLVRPEDQKAVRSATKPLAEDGQGTEAVSGPRGLSAVLMGELTAIRTAALRVELANRPEVALRALLMPLVSELFHGYRTATSHPVEIRGERKTLDQHIKEPEGCKALGAWQAVLCAWGERIPGEPESLWAWLGEQDITALLDLLAVVTAANLNGVSQTPTVTAPAKDIADAVGLDMATWWSPGQAFLSRIAKTDIASAMAEAGCREDAIASVDRTTKAEAVALAEREMEGKAWLPPVFRTAA
jgi:ParB family chromosome partitioning protein